MAHKLNGRLSDWRDFFLLEDLGVDLGNKLVHRLVEEAVAAQLLLDQRPWRLAGPEAGNLDTGGQLLIGRLDRLVMAILVDFNLELDLSLGEGLRCDLYCQFILRRRALRD